MLTFISGTMAGIIFLLFGIICLIIDKKAWKPKFVNILCLKLIFIEINKLQHNIVLKKKKKKLIDTKKLMTRCKL